jgi:hypothetical protein
MLLSLPVGRRTHSSENRPLLSVLASPEARGERPADLNHSLQFNRAFSRIAARDEAVQRLQVEVWHMLKPCSALQNFELQRRVEAEIARTVNA